MNKITQLLAWGIIALPLFVTAADDLQPRVIGEWVQPPWTDGIPSNPPPKWLRLAFQTNNVVKWSWEIKGKTQDHTGIFKVQKKPQPEEGMRQDYRIMIFPDTATFTTPLILDNVLAQPDNRFPADWDVLKFRCGEQESVVLTREADILRTSGSRLSETRGGVPQPQP